MDTIEFQDCYLLSRIQYIRKSNLTETDGRMRHQQRPKKKKANISWSRGERQVYGIGRVGMAMLQLHHNHDSKLHHVTTRSIIVSGSSFPVYTTVLVVSSN